jgi:hypothetical protein
MGTSKAAKGIDLLRKAIEAETEKQESRGKKVIYVMLFSL